ncbi:MAG: putative transporter [Bacteroidaceae bacterium]|nr:putative transporter [Bacteroidaceae bacterium]
MDWLENLLFNADSIAHIVLLYSFVIAGGVLLGKLKMFGVSLGVTFILFVGILMGHFGLTGNREIMNFVQDFGLILFVFCIGLQVGPSFFSSFKKGGVTMNLIATGVVLLNIAVMLVLWLTLFDTEDLPMLVGVLCGAVTNTPGLGAANEALSQMGYAGPDIANGYACAYPLGVVGIIGATILLRHLCRINFQKEEDELKQEEGNPHIKPHLMHVEVHNEALSGKTLMAVREFLNRDFVCSRILQNGHVSIPTRDTIFHVGDQLFIVCAEDDAEAIIAFIGRRVEVDWESQDINSPLISRRILVTQSKVNGKSLGELHFSSIYGVNVTRINRSGMDLFANPHLKLQVGDRLTVVGPQDAVERVANKMGNSLKRLDHPNIVTIFVGIFLGILFGSLPIAFPGIPTPVKLGLAGGPLIVAILIARFGYKLKLVTYTTMSANLMLREIGLALFLASVGIKAGANFVQTVVEGDGLLYVGCGFLITTLPILIMGLVARLKYKLNYFTLMGLIAGSTTDPPALAYANQTAGNDAPAVGYTTVYPLAMFLRIVTAQVIILLLCGY